jgi:hypothetical protein
MAKDEAGKRESTRRAAPQATLAGSDIGSGDHSLRGVVDMQRDISRDEWTELQAAKLGAMSPDAPRSDKVPPPDPPGARRLIGRAAAGEADGFAVGDVPA